jgi:hypothetical protein
MVCNTVKAVKKDPVYITPVHIVRPGVVSFRNVIIKMPTRKRRTITPHTPHKASHTSRAPSMDNNYPTIETVGYYEETLANKKVIPANPVIPAEKFTCCRPNMTTSGSGYHEEINI